MHPDPFVPTGSRCLRFGAFLVLALAACNGGAPLRIDAYGNAITESADGVALPSIAERMQHHGVPGMSIAVIRRGEIAWAKGYGVLQAGESVAVDAETIFSVGSVSKIGAAVVILRLVHQGRLDLDRDVNDYMSRWQIPRNEYTRVAQVTLRKILSHTAGLTVHGFADFQPGEDLPTTVEILEGTGPAKNRPVVVDLPIGCRFRYSGGGTTVVQLIVEDVTASSFFEAANELVFQPLEMSRSSYENPLPGSFENIAKAHGAAGRPRALPRGYEAMPEAAASGLWTTPSDYSKLMIALMDAHWGEADGFLSRRIAEDTMTEVAPSEFGLGPKMAGLGPTRVFAHSGANDSYKARIVGNLATRGGVVVFTNGARGDDLIDEIVPAIIAAENWPQE